MRLVKFLMAALGVVLVGLLIMWGVGFIWSMLWYLIVFGAVGALAIGGYRWFRRAEQRALDFESRSGIGTADIEMSWDEYDRKYLRK
ncbi:MAG: hypothetical protein KF736_07665 [Acidobacteria bacterium]|nr:hypothetical protein [Acidobacteriota bacterium]MCW5949003.1 hypothetical protein [Pyrinomonadaceae bacterium]